MTVPVATETIVRPVVLVVDDEPAVLEALHTLLAPRLEPAFQVETAASGDRALAWVAAIDPELAPLALVITDEKMPGTAGTDMLVALRQAPGHRDGGRIVVTGYAALPDAERAINDAEVDRYYPKPWDAHGALLPAVGSILANFARRRELDALWLAHALTFPEAREDVVATRRAWWEYVALAGMSAEEAGVGLPEFIDAADAAATHVVCERVTPRGREMAACVRLVVGAEGQGARLDQLVFEPGCANEQVEVLLLRAAIVEAAARGAQRVTVAAPGARRGLYQAAGFQDGAIAPDNQPVIEMEAATDALPKPFATRYAGERRLCACAQTGCPARDYAAMRRGYWCPLDMLEGRAPHGFPGPTK